MSKSDSFTLVLTMICLSVLVSLEADAQSTTDETNSCSSSSLEEVVNLVDRIASVQQEIKLQQQQNANEIIDIKELLVSNSSALHEVVNLVRGIASNQKENTKEIDKITSKSCESERAEPSKQTFVSALVSEFVSLYLTRIQVYYILGQWLAYDLARMQKLL